ncbi:DUF2269 domain-containing protein [Rhodobacteraceae bacterium NNCM2]|nr:DUF2269 domain-containing protein [Coraliihabitans acroporae]
MDLETLLRLAHVIGAAVLFGTGAGIAFFMLMAHRSGDAAHIARTAATVVLSDMIFTATAVVLQPLTGILLAHQIGWPLSQGWLVASVALYIGVGLFWLPVVWIQLRLRDLARQAAEAGTGLPARYHALYRLWFACGIPAFIGVVAIYWLMLARPSFEVF